MKTTRFKDILKVKKEKMSEVERALQDMQNRKNRLIEDIAEVDTVISELKSPENGDFGTLQVAREGFLALIKQRESLSEKVEAYNTEIEVLELLYKEATIEYEKIVYLDELEIKKIAKKIAEEESKALDEIANILFVNKREKVLS